MSSSSKGELIVTKEKRAYLWLDVDGHGGNVAVEAWHGRRHRTSQVQKLLCIYRHLDWLLTWRWYVLVVAGRGQLKGGENKEWGKGNERTPAILGCFGGLQNSTHSTHVLCCKAGRPAKNVGRLPRCPFVCASRLPARLPLKTAG